MVAPISRRWTCFGTRLCDAVAHHPGSATRSSFEATSMLRVQISLLLALLVAACATPSVPDHVVAHPIYRQYFLCGEHAAGELKGVGDALGTDCVVHQVESVNGRVWARSHIGEGERNEDWYGWEQEVLSPCSCKVARINLNPKTNQPGKLGSPPASAIELMRDDGVHFVLAHIDAPQIQVGDQVSAGQVIARVGNNGYSRHPHTHVGAWKGQTALQVRFDLTALGAIRREE